jgi:hypothetical protein
MKVETTDKSCVQVPARINQGTWLGHVAIVAFKKGSPSRTEICRNLASMAEV